MRSLKNKVSFIVTRLKGNQIVMLLSMWLVIRVVTSIWIALSSTYRPLTYLEQQVPVWPPSSPSIIWLERTFMAPWQRWDALWYQKIIVDGYDKRDGTAQFHPLYPWIAKPLETLGLHPLLSLMLVSSISCIFLIIFFNRLARIDWDYTSAQTGTILLITFPISFVLFAPYPEATFLLFAVLCLFWTRQRKWWWAGMAGALATLTRQQGILLLIPMAWEYWEGSGRSFHIFRRKWLQSLSILIPPLGWILWLAYRGLVLGDLKVGSGSLHAFIYSTLISPSASEVVTVQRFTWPWQAIRLSLHKLLNSPDVDIIVNFLLAGWFLVFMVAAWQKMRTSNKLYCLAITLISFCYYTGPVHPYMGLPRHLLLAFPVFIGIAPLINSPRLRLSATTFAMIGMIFLILLYDLEAWVP